MLFSILTTCYNQDKTIKDTISSCLNQTFDDFEIVISDDGSSDNSIAVIESFSDPRIRSYRQKKNLREYRNRNFLVENARGKYIIFVDAEDLLYPHALEVFAYYVQQFPEVGMVITHEWDDRLIYPLKLSPKELYQFAFLDNGAFFGGNFTNMLFKRQTVIDAGLFPTNVKSGDTYMQFKLALTESALIINTGLAWWRRSSGNVTEKLSPQYSASDYCHLANTINYKLEMLNDESCPLSNSEIELSKTNMFGSCLRITFSWLIKGRFKKIYYLYKNLDIPLKYYPAFFKKSKHNYFNTYSGDNPMRTVVKTMHPSLASTE